MKLISVIYLILFPFILYCQASENKSKKTRQKSPWINWGTWSLGYQIATAHAHNLYSFANKSDYSDANPVDAKFSAPVFYFKIENITRYIYWNFELGLPISKSTIIENEKDPIFDNFQGKARFGRMINVPVSLGGFVNRSLGFWVGYNFSLYYLRTDAGAFTAGNSYVFTEKFRAGDVGILFGNGINFHTMLRMGPKSLFRFTIAGTTANNKAGSAKGGAVATEYVYFIAFKKGNLSNGLMFRFQSTKVNVTDHAFKGRFNNEDTSCKSQGLGFGLCFDLPETRHRQSDIHH